MIESFASRVSGSRAFSAGVVLIFCATAMLGCSTAEETQSSMEETAQAETETPIKETGTPIEEIDYTLPYEANTYCEVLEDLEAFNSEVDNQTEVEAAHQLDQRLEILTKTGAQLSTLSEASDASEAWENMSESYSNLHDFFLSSGQQVTNDEFLALLAETTSISNSTFTSQTEEAETKCGVDLSQFLVGDE